MHTIDGLTNTILPAKIVVATVTILLFGVVGALFGPAMPDPSIEPIAATVSQLSKPC